MVRELFNQLVYLDTFYWVFSFESKTINWKVGFQVYYCQIWIFFKAIIVIWSFLKLGPDNTNIDSDIKLEYKPIAQCQKVALKLLGMDNAYLYKKILKFESVQRRSFIGLKIKLLLRSDCQKNYRNTKKTSPLIRHHHPIIITHISQYINHCRPATIPLVPPPLDVKFTTLFYHTTSHLIAILL